MTKSSYFANKETKVYHDAGINKDACRVSEIKLSNRVYFNSVEEAEGAGYHPCALCIEKDLS